MKNIKQFIAICIFWQFGEFISPLLPIKIPGSILGMVMLYAALLTGVIKLNHVEECSNRFLKDLGLFFIPPSVALITTADLLKSQGITLIFIVMLTTLLTMALTGKILDFLIGEKI